MPATAAYRYTLMVQSLGDESRFTIHGTFTLYAAAANTAATWQAVMDRRFGPNQISVSVRTLYPMSAAVRDQQWGAE